MLLSKEEYRESIKDMDIDELVKERHFLYREIRRFETNKITEEERNTKPSPLTLYECNNEYLVEVTKLINTKIIELKELIPIEKTYKLNYIETGFRAIYNNFIVYPLNKELKTLVKGKRQMVSATLQ